MDDSQTDTAAGNHPVEAPPARAGAARRARSTASALRAILVGAVCGLAWSAAFRAWMAEIAGGASRLDWYGTFVGILGAGVIVGALIGLAEYFRRTGGRRAVSYQSPVSSPPSATIVWPLT